MASDRRQQALSVFGVVQYLKRVPLVAEVNDETELSAAVESATEPEPAGVSVASSIQDLKAVAAGLESDARGSSSLAKAGTLDSKKSPQQTDLQEQESVAAVENARKFDLRFWRSGNLLAVESARESDDADMISPEIRHRLANSIFRAIFGEKTSGTTMYTHSWPDEVGAAKAGDDSAIEWLNLFLKGQKAKDPDTKLWLMGQDALELLLSDHGTADELEGMRIQDNKLTLEIYVTSSLEQMISKPFLKATTWKLLRVLSPQ